jgi:hypothetical protein
MLAIVGTGCNTVDAQQRARARAVPYLDAVRLRRQNGMQASDAAGGIAIYVLKGKAHSASV